ncbi:Uncharacterised protein [Grimontia hollisae]|uniref:Uncharacterized protein n=1 Tax=Grimontia hollisae TaxID=673 RepID=A0A377HLL8_GRIHO|nr:Uncharacterised protein [Grimontia hollisae]
MMKKSRYTESQIVEILKEALLTDMIEKPAQIMSRAILSHCSYLCSLHP